MSNHGIPPKCRREACEKPAKWSDSSAEWGAYCGNECYRLDQKSNIKYVRFHAKKEVKHPVDHGEPPKCERDDCQKLVKWRAGRWNSYCSPICSGKDISRMVARKRPRDEFDEPMEDTIPSSWLRPLD